MVRAILGNRIKGWLFLVIVAISLFSPALSFEVLNGRFGSFFIICGTHSMEPTLTCKSNLTMEQVRTNTPLNVGDIVTFQSGRNIIHRIVAIETKLKKVCMIIDKKEVCEMKPVTLFWTKGDNNCLIDDPIQRFQIFYKVTAINGKSVPLPPQGMNWVKDADECPFSGYLRRAI